jgi:hypothetical protein
LLASIGFHVVQILQARASGCSYKQNAIISSSEHCRHGELQCRSMWFNGGKAPRIGRVAPKNVSFLISACIDAANLTKHTHIAIFAAQNILVCHAKKHIAWQRAIGHHRRHFDAATIANSPRKAHCRAFRDGYCIAIVTAQHHRLLADVVTNAALAQF